MARFSPRLRPLDRRDTPSVFLRFDYTYDTSGFFTDPARRQALEAAGATITGRLTDTLSAISPVGRGDTWTAAFTNPFTNAEVRLDNLSIAADEIRVYVGGGPLTSSELGIASTAYSASGSPAWLSTVVGRGQAGADAQAPAAQTDFATWGGFLGFDSGVQWNFTAGNPTANQFDFPSVASHEILHLLGFGLDNHSFSRFVSNGTFVGPASQAAAGGPVPLDAAADHWRQGTTSNGTTAVEVPAIGSGEKRPVTPLDYAALSDIGWQLTAAGSPPVVPPVIPPVVPVVPVVPPPPPDPGPGAGTPVRFAVAADAGSVSTFSPVNADGAFVFTAQPFDSAFEGGTRVASGDFNGDGVKDVAVGTGPGAVTLVRVYDGSSQQLLFQVQPFEGAFVGGVYLAAGDLTGDGRADLVVSPDEGGGPRVDVYSGNGFARISSFFGIDDPNFRGGARACVGDVSGDGRADLIVAAGFGGGPRVAGFSGQSVTRGSPVRVFNDFFAFEQGLRNGVYVAAGDITGDGRAEVIAGGGPGGGPRVTAFGGRELASSGAVPVANFFAGTDSDRGGVRVAVADLDGDALADVVTGSGAGDGSRLTGYPGATLTRAGGPPTAFAFDFYPGFTGGLFVG